MRLTVFPDLSGKEFSEHDISLSNLPNFLSSPSALSKAALPLFKMAIFSGESTSKGSKRADRFVRTLTGMEIDYDAGEISIEEAQATLEKAGVQAVLYTSPSWTQEHPKWRALLPFSKECTSGLVSMRRRCFRILDPLFPGAIAPESRTLSQAYFFGHLEGKPIRVLQTKGQAIDFLSSKLSLVPSAEDKDDAPLDDAPSKHIGTEEHKALIQNLYNGVELHPTLVRLAMMYANRGLDGPSITATIEGFMGMSTAARDERYASRVAEIPRIVDSAVAKAAFDRVDLAGDPDQGEGDEDEDEDGNPKSKALPWWHPDQDDELEETEVYEPPVVVPGLIWKDIAVLAGEGGRGKTTLMVQMAVALAAGSEFLGFTPLAPVKIVFFTQEDDAHLLRNKAKACCLACNLDWGIAKKNLRFVWLDAKLAAQKTFKTEADIEFVKALSARLVEYGASLAIFDPLVAFAGEETNEGFSQVIRAVRQIVRKADCGVLMAHHTGKSSRDDQYAARGGSSLVDGSRMVMNLSYQEAEEFASSTGTQTPRGGYRWSFEKTSHIERPLPKFLLRSDRFSFREVLGLTEEQRSSARREAQATRSEERTQAQIEVEQVLQHRILAAVEQGAESKKQITEMIGGNSTQLRSLIDRMVESELLSYDMRVTNRGGSHPLRVSNQVLANPLL